MAIIIPSKHIYSKNFDPVIDNNIDRVEAGIKKPANEIQNEAVSSETYNSFSPNKAITKDGRAQDYSMYFGAEYFTVAYSEYDNAYYAHIEAIIPIHQNNKYVQKIVTGVSDTGDPKIQYAVYGTIESGSITGTLNTNWNGDLGVMGVTPNTIKENQQTIKENEVFNLRTKNEYTYTREVKETPTSNPFTTHSAKVELDFSTVDIANVKIVQAEKINADRNPAWKLDLVILSGYRIFNVGAYYDGSRRNIPQTINIAEGNYTTYIPTRIEITINGVVFKLNLEDNTIKVGNGNKVFSFDGNELIQDTNTPSIKSKYQGIIDKWKNGKQVAIITCPITDYFDEDGGRVVSGNVRSGEVLIRIGFVGVDVGDEAVSGYDYCAMFSDNRSLQKGDVLIYENEKAIVFKYIDNVNVGQYYVLQIIPRGAFASKSGSGDFVVYQPPLHMTIQIGDIVIPYTYTNQGNKPLSYNRDFTPKQFKVVGTKISKRQGGTQELTLQEI